MTVTLWLVSWLAAVPQVREGQSYVGKSSCLPELSRADHYGIRLDASQAAYLNAYKWDGKNILTIVQYAHDGEKCGTIRDVVQSRNASSVFIFECTNREKAADVIVGTWPERYSGKTGPAAEAWKIDLRVLRFNKVQGAGIRCVNQDYSGIDEGDDLATWAKKRADKQSRIQKH